MRKEHWYWFAGGTIFVTIVGLWIWQLPSILAYAQKGKQDAGLSAIMSSLGKTGDGMSEVQDRLDNNLKKIDQAFKTEATKAAAIDDLKKKIEEENSKNIQAATLPIDSDNTNINTPNVR